jgi:hypothetical protein
MPRIVHMPPRPDGGKQGLDDYISAGGNLEELLDGAVEYTGFESVDAHSPILSGDALQGLAGRCVREIDPHTEAAQVAVLVNMLLGFGSLIHQGAYVRIGPQHHHLNEYAVLVGRSGKARKGTSWAYPEALFREVDEGWATGRVVSGLASGEGLIYAIRDPVEAFIRKSGEMEIVDCGVSDKRLMVVEGEFARLLRVMGRDGNSLSAVLRDAYDRDRLENQTKNDPHRSTGAHISLIGHITQEELRRHLNQTEQANGFANRIMFISVGRSKKLPFGGGMPEDHDELVRELRASAEFGRNVGEVEWGESSKDLWAEEIYPDLSEGEEGLVGAMLGRAETHVLRIGALYAVMDRCRTIEPPHLFAALSLWDYCEASTRLIFGNTSGDRTFDTLVNALRNAGDGSLTRTEIHRAFSGHTSRGEIERSLMTLLSQGRASRIFEKTDGRPVERWRFVR